MSSSGEKTENQPNNGTVTALTRSNARGGKTPFPMPRIRKSFNSQSHRVTQTLCPQSCGSRCTWAEPERWGCTFPGTAPKWCGFFNYICLSWLHSRNHLSLPFSFQLFFLIYLCSSHLSSLPSKQAEEEKNAEKNRYAKKEKHVQTILLHN